MRKLLLDIYDRHVRPLLFRIRTWWPFWFNILNRTPRALFSAQSPELSLVQARILGDLQKYGIATSTIKELFGEKYDLKTLKAFVDGLPLMPTDETQSKKDVFLKRLWPVRLAMDFKNPFLRLSLEPVVLDIANSYMQMWVKLKYYDLAETIPVRPDSEARYSQNWHRDPEEKRLMKLFIYMTDVDEGAGPFVYIPESIYGSRLGYLFPQQTPAGSYPSDNEVERAIPLSGRKTMLGEAGTIIFCDTSGIHRGGYSIERPRTMFTASYTAPSSHQDVWYTKVSPPEDLAPSSLYAITHD